MNAPRGQNTTPDMKKTLFIIVLACLLAPILQAGKPKTPSQITILSYNIRHGEAQDGTNAWVLRYPASAMMIEDQKPDVFGLQEALSYQVQYMQEYTTDYKHVGVGRDNGKKEGEYMAVFYNTNTIKLLKWGTFWLSDTPDEPSVGWDAACKRTATWTLMQDKNSGKKFYYVNTHLDHIGKEAREKGLSLILEKMAQMNTDGLPVVLGGDFNMTSDDPAMAEVNRKMKSARLQAPRSDMGYTFNDWGKRQEGEQPIDHIYYTGFSSCPVFEVIRKEYYGRKFISDHFPIKATLIF